MLELDFEMLPAIEPMRAEDIQFLLVERMERVEHRNFTRIAGIIAAGLSARPTDKNKVEEPLDCRFNNPILDCESRRR